MRLILKLMNEFHTFVRVVVNCFVGVSLKVLMLRLLDFLEISVFVSLRPECNHPGKTDLMKVDTLFVPVPDKCYEKNTK